MSTPDNQVSSTSEDEDSSLSESITSSRVHIDGPDVIGKVIRGLFHITTCFDSNDCDETCAPLKKFMQHCRICIKRRFEFCEFCSIAVAITAFHSKVCLIEPCPLMFCEVIKEAIKTYPPDSYHLRDLDHLTHRVVCRLQDLNPNKQLSEEEDGEAKEAVKYKWAFDGSMEQVEEISSTTLD